LPRQNPGFAEAMATGNTQLFYEQRHTGPSSDVQMQLEASPTSCALHYERNLERQAHGTPPWAEHSGAFDALASATEWCAVLLCLFPLILLPLINPYQSPM